VDRSSIGRRGEDLAAQRLIEDGFILLERNYRRAGGEIDLIARKDGLLVFCEVKARASERWGGGWEAVNQIKVRRLRATAGRWLAERKPGPVRIRFDVVSIVFDGPDVTVRHLIDAF
jgi:putative endonuclease